MCYLSSFGTLVVKIQFEIFDQFMTHTKILNLLFKNLSDSIP
jgi:hypothetical protein